MSSAALVGPLSCRMELLGRMTLMPLECLPCATDRVAAMMAPRSDTARVALIGLQAERVRDRDDRHDGIPKMESNSTRFARESDALNLDAMASESLAVSPNQTRRFLHR